MFISVFGKCLFNGYEYITTTLIMMLVPYVYYSTLNRLSARQFLTGFFVAVLGSFFAILLSFTILCFQIASVKGSMMAGVEQIVFSFGARTHGNPNDFPSSYTENLNSSTIDVTIRYLKGTFFDLNNYLSTSNSFVSWYLFKIRYIYLISLFLVMSGLVFLGNNGHYSVEQRKNKIALLFAVWFSILAPLSWFIIFKAHSSEHYHMNYIVWQMPFTFFGFALCGLTIKGLLLDIGRRSRRFTSVGSDV